MGVRIVRALCPAASWVYSSVAHLGMIGTCKSCHILGIHHYGLVYVGSIAPEYDICAYSTYKHTVYYGHQYGAPLEEFFALTTLGHLTNLKTVYGLIFKINRAIYIKIFKTFIFL